MIEQEFETWWQENVGNDDFCYLDKGDALECWQAAILAERERCAAIAEQDKWLNGYNDVGQHIADTIRQGVAA